MPILQTWTPVEADTLLLAPIPVALPTPTGFYITIEPDVTTAFRLRGVLRVSRLQTLPTGNFFMCLQRFEIRESCQFALYNTPLALGTADGLIWQPFYDFTRVQVGYF